jgi:hypothetical protein
MGEREGEEQVIVHYRRGRRRHEEVVVVRYGAVVIGNVCERVAAILYFDWDAMCARKRERKRGIEAEGSVPDCSVCVRRYQVCSPGSRLQTERSLFSNREPA